MTATSNTWFGSMLYFIHQAFYVLASVTHDVVCFQSSWPAMVQVWLHRSDECMEQDTERILDERSSQSIVWKARSREFWTDSRISRGSTIRARYAKHISSRRRRVLEGWGSGRFCLDAEAYHRKDPDSFKTMFRSDQCWEETRMLYWSMARVLDLWQRILKVL